VVGTARFEVVVPEPTLATGQWPVALNAAHDIDRSTEVSEDNARGTGGPQRIVDRVVTIDW